MNPMVIHLDGARPLGGADVKHPGLDVPIKGKAFSQATESDPLPVVWGKLQRAGTYIMPVFGLRAEPVTQEIGK
jgi:hypothetical protein